MAGRMGVMGLTLPRDWVASLQNRRGSPSFPSETRVNNSTSGAPPFPLQREGGPGCIDRTHKKGRNLVRKRSAQLHIRCREAKNSANSRTCLLQEDPALLRLP